jgi:hypothetical protein
MAKLTVNEAASSFTHVVKLDYVALAAIGTGGTDVLITLPAGSAIDLVMVDESVAFAGTTSLVVDIGTTLADPDEFIDALDVDAMSVPVFNTGDIMVQSVATTTFLGGALPVKAVASATPVYIKVTDATIGSATAGQITIGFRVLDLRQFA